MEKLHYTITINAPKEHVWHMMLDDKPYREWTLPFNATGSYYEGKWEEGSDMLFLGPEADGSVSGMYSRVAAARPYDFVSIEHLGEIRKGERHSWPTEMADSSIFENYTFVEKDGATEVLVELDSNEQFKAMFDEMWPKALLKLKEISERGE